jgi:hypothetical protein
MSDQEEPAPSAPLLEIGEDEAGSNAEQASSAHKRRKTGLTRCEDEYAVSKQREALGAKANTSKFSGLRAETPAESSSAKTAKHGGKVFRFVLTEVFFIVWKRRFNPVCCLFLQLVFRCLVLRPAFRCLACLDLA